MTAALMKRDDSTAMEAVLIEGDLSKLTSEQRVMYYKKTCESLGLNYLTKPFAYIRLNGKLTFYALKDCTEQLRNRDGVSIYEMKSQTIEGVHIVTAYARTKDGKEDVSTGAVTIQGLKGEALANAMMKAETKAKRRVTLSVCGLGFLDDSETESISGAQKINVTEHGEIIESTVKTTPNVALLPRTDLIEVVSRADTLESLKNAFEMAYRAHEGQPDIQQQIIELKDARKAQMLVDIEAFKQQMVSQEDDGA